NKGDLVHVAGEHESGPRGARRSAAGRSVACRSATGRRASRARQARNAVAQRIAADVAGICGETGADDLPDLFFIPGRTTRFGELLEEGRGFHGRKIPAASVRVQPGGRAGKRGRRLFPKHARIRMPPRGTAANERNSATYPCASRIYPAATLARNEASPAPIAL